MKSEAQRNSKIRESLTRNARAALGKPVEAGEHKSPGHREQQYYTRFWSGRGQSERGHPREPRGFVKVF